jgi:hypothetical protein
MSHSFGQWFNECGLPGSYCRHRSMRSPAGLASYQAVENQFGRSLARRLCVSRAEILGIGLARRCSVSVVFAGCQALALNGKKWQKFRAARDLRKWAAP